MFTVDPGKAAIYGLYDPIDGELRYVGMTTRPRIRMNSHRIDTKGPSHKSRWMAKLKRQGLEPEMSLLDMVDEADAAAREIEIIALMRDCGVRLTNSTIGGDGAILSNSEAMERKKATMRKTCATPEYKARQSKALKDSGHRPPAYPGEKHYLAKLTDKAVVDIRRRLKTGEPLKDVAASFPNISKAAIQNAGSGKTWRHVQEHPYSPNHKTTPESRMEMKRLYKSGVSQPEIAEMFDIHSSYVSMIVRDKMPSQVRKNMKEC